jgi:hypothetical protein
MGLVAAAALLAAAQPVFVEEAEQLAAEPKQEL